MEERIKNLLMKRYAGLVKRHGIAKHGDDAVYNALVLVENTRQFVDSWRKAAKRGKHFDEKELNNVLKIEPNFQNLFAKSEYDFAKTIVENESKLKQLCIKLAKNPIFDQKRCIMQAFTAPGGIFIDPVTKKTHCLGMASIKLKTHGANLDVDKVVKELVADIKKRMRENPGNRIAFCPYQFRVAKLYKPTKNGSRPITTVVARYAIHAL